MTTQELLDKLRTRGVIFTLKPGGVIHWHIDSGLTPHYVRAIDERASQILELLRAEEACSYPDFPFDATPHGTCSQGHNQWALRRDNRGWNCRKCHPTVCR